jgi:uncharacterized membrane protein
VSSNSEDKAQKWTSADKYPGNPAHYYRNLFPVQCFTRNTWFALRPLLPRLRAYNCSFPQKNGSARFARIALSFGFSIAITSLIGLILNYTSFGIRLYPSLIAIFIFTIAMSAIAGMRQRGLPEEEKISISFSLSPPSGQGSLSRILSIILVVVIVGTIGTLGYVIATPKVGEKFTEFYILNVEGTATNYPKELSLGDEGQVTIGIVNREQQTTSYRIEVRIDGLENSEVGPLTLEPDAKWEAPLSFKPDKAGENQKVEFLLFKTGQSEPYLKPLYLWVNVNGGGG